MPRSVLDLASLGPRFASFVAGLERPLVFFDLETTGIDPVRDRIVELSLVRLVPPDTIEPPRTWRIDPEMKIPAEAQDIHGISNADLVGAPTFAALAPTLVELLRDADLGGFGISRLDLRMLQAELQRANVALDLAAARLVDAQVIFHRREPRDLTAAVAFYRGKTLEGAHGAEADTLASLEVFAGQLDRYADLETDVEALNVLTTQLNANYVDRGRKFAWRDGEPVFNFGKLRGKPLRAAASEPSERDYLRWIANGPFDDEVKILVQEALAGRIRRREA